MELKNKSLVDESLAIPVGISACLIGEKVRFDGGHKQSRYCLNVLAECFKFVPFCPEVSIGLGIPREPIRLVKIQTEQGESQVRVQGTKDTSLDVTDELAAYADLVSKNQPELCGYVLMKSSPSCGMERVKVYDHNNVPEASGAGAFAQRYMELNPEVPVEEEGRLNDPLLRENFITRVFALHTWREQVLSNPSLHAVIQFHSCYKYQLMAHSYQAYKELGRYLATEAPKEDLELVLETYIHKLMTSLKKRANRKSHCNVLMHILGYLKHELDSKTKHDILEAIDQYRTSIVPLVVPITLLKHYLKRHGSEYIRSQAYLDPYPHELGLRNYI
ncbi:YbgA family protein [Agaribacterium sp. ZY112]|uniref:YbgA family protein n=1 Tax=Agaribacterium sp. ZY112 TaxID=3233574 RepID=UPI003524AA9C